MIPKIVHHVWPGQDPFRAEFRDFRASWMRHHPDWTFVFWRGDESVIDDKRVREVLDHDSYSVIVKSDILRLYALVLMGGLYVDTDFECLKPVDDLLASGGFHCGWQDHANLAPSLMACAAGDPFAQKYLDNPLRLQRACSLALRGATPRSESDRVFISTRLLDCKANRKHSQSHASPSAALSVKSVAGRM